MKKLYAGLAGVMTEQEDADDFRGITPMARMMRRPGIFISISDTVT